MILRESVPLQRLWPRTFKRLVLLLAFNCAVAGLYVFLDWNWLATAQFAAWALARYAGRQAQPHVQRLAVHALDLPLPEKALVLARVAGKSGHAGNRHRCPWKVNQADSIRTVQAAGKPFNVAAGDGGSPPGDPPP